MPEQVRGGEVGVTLPPRAAWWESGERAFGTATARLVDEEFDRPSLLVGWTRAHVLSHVAGNADALVNLLSWARTGVETPMYASPEARDAEIGRRAALEPRHLRAEVGAATERLADAVRSLPEHGWAAEVRTAQGRTVTTDEILWIRAREVWVHAIDLGTGVRFDDVPEDVLSALVDEVFGTWERRDVVPDVTVSAGNRQWGRGAIPVSGSLPEVTGWVTGRASGGGLRCDAAPPKVPAWL